MQRPKYLTEDNSTLKNSMRLSRHNLKNGISHLL
uniref:Uncharacterized protein n=1 Tax=Anguilla anguilla TaxID=7936 RepID=A0A0E9XS98_ANGAN